MLNTLCDDAFLYEKILARYVAPVADDLRLLELGPLVSFMASGRLDNLASVIEASCELYFKENTLSFCSLGEVDIGWQRRPRLLLDMKLELEGVVAAFRLILDADSPAVELTYISFRDPALSEPERLRHFEKRIRAACGRAWRGRGVEWRLPRRRSSVEI